MLYNCALNFNYSLILSPSPLNKDLVLLLNLSQTIRETKDAKVKGILKRNVLPLRIGSWKEVRILKKNIHFRSPFRKDPLCIFSSARLLVSFLFQFQESLILCKTALANYAPNPSIQDTACSLTQKKKDTACCWSPPLVQYIYYIIL